jgi:hypothetical protein
VATDDQTLLLKSIRQKSVCPSGGVSNAHEKSSIFNGGHTEIINRKRDSVNDDNRD